jgi:hypothetical protein
MKTISNFAYDHPRLAASIAILLVVGLLATGYALLGERVMQIIYGLATFGIVGWIVYQNRSTD